MSETVGEIVKTEENSVNIEKEAEVEGKGIDLDRVHIKNLPKFIGVKQFKKLLEKILGDVKSKKIRYMSDYAYVTFESPEDSQKAILLLNGYEFKKCKFTAHLATTEVKDLRPETRGNKESDQPKTARESVTPLAEMKYEEQLELKQTTSEQTMDKLHGQLKYNSIANIGKQGQFRQRLQKILPVPKTTGYRNKCEFTIGNDINGDICVGFVGGRFAEKKHFVIPPINVDIVSNQMMAIIKDASEFVKETSLQPFDEFERKGFWRMLTIREFGGDVMLIFTVFPLEVKEKTEEIQKKIEERFMDFETFTTKQFRVCSIYWQEMIHISDSPNFKLIAGTPYIYESLLDCRFRVSPPAFFQTNSQAAAVLYSKIGELCGLVESSKPTTEEAKKPEEVVPEETKEENLEDDAPLAKIAKIDSEASPAEDHGTILLDICCGTGTIGQCLLKNIQNTQKVCCVGIEMIPEAVEDAKQNAKQNKMEKCCKYIAGKAEDTFRSMRYHLPNGFDLKKSRVVGVLDPPRAGMHEKVILACREMETMRRLIFVSCEPNAAINNIVNLCRPESRKFIGAPFSVTRVQPVDMFPQTKHMEWIIQLDR
uniref:tRNA (uracil(54)-C(5))-methyltransferase n=1 Tax=Caenorhabditis tropicalis TaxID=1561998 RepID=A0A1I7TYM5_9PELO